jgi:hypothetical protein
MGKQENILYFGSRSLICPKIKTMVTSQILVITMMNKLTGLITESNDGSVVAVANFESLSTLNILQ